MAALVNELLPFKVRSLRSDNGSENAEFPVLEEAFGANIAFCHPRSPREKAQVEERIKRIRELFGRNTGFRCIHQRGLDDPVNQLSRREMPVHKKEAGERRSPESFNNDIKEGRSENDNGRIFRAVVVGAAVCFDAYNFCDPAIPRNSEAWCFNRRHYPRTVLLCRRPTGSRARTKLWRSPEREYL